MSAPTTRTGHASHDPSPAPPPPPKTPQLTGAHAVELLAVTGAAAAIRVAAAWALGEGAPFGPDGTGAEAAVHLGGHLYPLHIELIRYAGDARTASLVTGTLSVTLLWLIGHRTRIGGAGAWLAAFLPLSVYPSALSAGDAPALFVVLLGVFLATFGRVGEVIGGALAMASVMVKPIALPAMALFFLRPLGFLGAALTLPWVGPTLKPLWAPKARSGILGNWWPELGGNLPLDPADFAYVVQIGVQQYIDQELWVGTLLVPLAAMGALFPHREGAPEIGTLPRASVIPMLFVGIVVAGAFGDILSPRYLAAAIVPLLLWLGILVPRPLAFVLLLPTWAVISQVADYRKERDPLAVIPTNPIVIDIPQVDARALFEESSTQDATAMRQEAARLAATLPKNGSVRIERRAHGREGELTWPLKVARPDVNIVVED